MFDWFIGSTIENSRHRDFNAPVGLKYYIVLVSFFKTLICLSLSVPFPSSLNVSELYVERERCLRVERSVFLSVSTKKKDLVFIMDLCLH